MNQRPSEELANFHRLLIKETIQLKDLEAQASFCEDPTWQVGLELEGWILDKNFAPQPLAPKMMADLDGSQLSEEIIKEVFEINPKPVEVRAGFLERFDRELTALLKRCQHWASANNVHLITIGMLPHIPPDYFKTSLFAENIRLSIINTNLAKIRNFEPWHIKIHGEDSIDLTVPDICIEALTTSTQFHVKVPHHQVVDTYNRAQLLAAPMVALASNAPFLNKKSLWADTRIPLAQQSTSEQLPPRSFRNSEDRVLFGHSYVKESMMELFDQNLKFKILAPLIEPGEEVNFYHLKLHNGTIWRWNRPVVGADDNDPKKSHIRLEHRVQSAGTTPCDISAQLAFFVGMLAYWQQQGFKPETCFAFDTIRANFYTAARNGLEANINWSGTRPQKVLDVIREELMPKAKKGLLEIGISLAEVSYYLDEILGQRLSLALSGASWQKNTARLYKGVIPMLEKYHAHQQSLKPLWRWN